MAISSLPPGFRFHPTDVELILYYLKRKVLGKRLAINAIPELDLYKFSPWDLPDKSCLRSRDLEWYFFCPKDRKYAQGVRTNRATDIGYWKATGRDRPICNDSQTVGMKKTLIFHLGRASQGKRTNWVMHEYRLEIKDWNDAGISQDLYVLCKIFEKSGAGPKNGEQHGAPFKEEEWEDDVMQNHLVALPIVDNDFPSIILDDGKSTAPENSTLILRETCESSLQPSFQNASSDASGENDFPSNNLDDGKSTAPGNSTLVLRETCKSSLQPSCQNASLDASGENNSLLDGVDMDSLLALLDEENDLFPIGNDGNEMPELLNYDCHVEVPHPADGNDIFAGLEDINTRTKLKGIDNLNFADMEDSYVLNQTLLGDDMAYMELDDFNCPMKYPVKGDVSKHNQLENFGGRLEIESGDSLGVRNSALSRENVSFKELDDLNFSKKYSLEVNSKNVPSGFAFLESVHPASGVGPSRRTLPSNSDVYSENVTVASNVGVGPSGFMFPKISDEHVVDDVGVVSTATVFGAGMSGCLLPKDSGVVPGNLELLQDQIDSGGASVGGGYKDAKQIPNVDLGEGERVNTNSSQTLARGKQHRAKSRLLCLLGSIPARPAAGAEFPYIIAGKGSKGSSLCANGCGSSIHVKAEVTVRCGCTEEALSGKLGEFPYLCCYPCGFLSRSELEKRAAAYSSRFTFVFLLGLIAAALMWVFIISTIFRIGNWIVLKDDLISVRLLC